MKEIEVKISGKATIETTTEIPQLINMNDNYSVYLTPLLPPGANKNEVGVEVILEFKTPFRITKKDLNDNNFNIKALLKDYIESMIDEDKTADYLKRRNE